MSESRQYEVRHWETICGHLEDTDAHEELRDEIAGRIGDADALTDLLTLEMTWDQARAIDTIVRENAILTERMDDDND